MGSAPTPPPMDRPDQRLSYSHFNPRSLFKDCVFFLQAADRDDDDQEIIRSEISAAIVKHGGKTHKHPHPPFVTHILLPFLDAPEDELKAALEVQCRDLGGCTFEKHHLNDTKTWEWTEQHLVRHFAGSAYRDPPHLARYSDAVTVKVPTANLIPKPVLAGDWVQRCVASKRQLGEEDGWDGCLIWARFPLQEKRRLRALRQAEQVDTATPLARRFAADHPPSLPGATDTAANKRGSASVQVIPKPHPMLRIASISTEELSTPTLNSQGPLSVPVFKLAGSRRLEENPPKLSGKPTKKTVVFVDPPDTSDSPDSSPPPIRRIYTTATLRNTTNIGQEPIALKRPAPPGKGLSVKQKPDSHPPSKRRKTQRTDVSGSVSQRQVAVPARPSVEVAEPDRSAVQRMNRKEALTEFENDLVLVNPVDRAPLRNMVDEMLRQGVYKGSRGLYKACDNKPSRTAYTKLMKDHKDMIMRRLAVG